MAADALPRLAFLRDALEHGAAERMQSLFPEGYFFSHALYGLTWIDVAHRDTGLRGRALTEARWAAARLDDETARSPFSPVLDPPYGVFYVGWSTWLRGGIADLDRDDAVTGARVRRDAEALARAFGASRSPFLPAYPGQAWPVDSTVGIAALRLADRIAGTDAYRDTVEAWLTAARDRRDPVTGLLAHRADPESGRPIEGARATSMTVALRFLREVDPDGAVADWRVFRERFASTVPGVPGIREHPQGTDGPGDVDSGPLFLGLSASASVVALGDAVLFGDRAAAAELTGLAEATGAGITWDGKRRYLGGAMPIGDAFLAWSSAATGWVVPAAPPHGSASGRWRFLWYATTLWIIAPVWLAAAALLGQLKRAPVGVPGRA